MKQDSQIYALANLMPDDEGWHMDNCGMRIRPLDFTNDLNAAFQAEIAIIYARGKGMIYLAALTDLVNRSAPFESHGVSIRRWNASATAAQRCEAILRTADKWTE